MAVVNAQLVRSTTSLANIELLAAQAKCYHDLFKETEDECKLESDERINDEYLDVCMLLSAWCN